MKKIIEYADPRVPLLQLQIQELRERISKLEAQAPKPYSRLWDAVRDMNEPKVKGETGPG